MLRRLTKAFCIGLLSPALFAGWALAVPPPIPADQLADIDLHNPTIASASDAALYWRAYLQLRHALSASASSHRSSLPSYYSPWIASQLPGWNFYRWFYNDVPFVLRGRVVLCGPHARGPAADLIVAAADQVARFLHRHFNIPTPRYAICVRLFQDFRALPPEVAAQFSKHRGLSSVAGLTIPPRFVIIPTALSHHSFWPSRELLVRPDGKIASLLTFRDIVYHELVHATIHATAAELSDAGQRPPPSDIPTWLDEGLAVYITERLKIEPGTKPASYYRFAAPLHYLEDEWGDELLRDFINAAVTRGYPAALRQLPFSEDRLLELADRHYRRPKPLASVIKSLLYLVAFLAALVGLALVPAAAGWLWRRLLTPALAGLYAIRLRRLWTIAWRHPSNPSAAIAFLHAYRRAPSHLRDAFAWQRFKLFLLLGK